MLIDWFTVVAQIINFLILVFLMRRFLYNRIIQAMDGREERIGARLQEADKKKKMAEKEAEAYLQKKQELEDEKARMLAEAKKDAEEKRKELVEQARKEADQLEKRWKEALETHKGSFLRNLRQLAQRQVYDISRRVLQDLAGVDVEERAIKAFLNYIAETKEEAKDNFVLAVRKGDGMVTVSSGFEIPEEQRGMIEGALRKEIGARTGNGIEIGYRVNPNIGFGIEVVAHGRKLAWSLASYLKTLEKRAGESLDSEAEKA